MILPINISRVREYDQIEKIYGQLVYCQFVDSEEVELYLNFPEIKDQESKRLFVHIVFDVDDNYKIHSHAVQSGYETMDDILDRQCGVNFYEIPEEYQKIALDSCKRVFEGDIPVG